MTHKTLKQDVWRLLLVPSIAITLLLSLLLCYLFTSQVSKFIDHRGSILTMKTAILANAALAKGDQDLAQTLVDATLEEPYVRAVALYDQSTHKTYHAGPQFFKFSSATPSLTEPSRQQTLKSIRFAHPIGLSDTQAGHGWVEIELLTSPFLVLRYESIIITLIATILCLLLAGVLAFRLHERITIPLNQIRNVANKFANGKFDARVEDLQNSEFKELVDAFNNIGETLEQHYQELQLNVNQSMEDLQETLETIEIQNVELDIARKEALEASRIKSEFLANTSHEIKTPLNGILGFTNLALKTNLDQQQRDYLNTVRDSSQTLMTIINDILDFSKIEADKLTLDYMPLHLRRTLEDTLQILAPEAHEKHIQLISSIAPNIPLSLLGDPMRFKQVLSNLINNAIKFSPKGKGNVSIDISLVSQEETRALIKVAISDQGIGLNEQQRGVLFKPFVQIDTSSSREHGGTGLGLAICKGLVERMGGSIGVESQPDEGSTFWFTASVGIAKNQVNANPFNIEGHKILICGENTAINQQLSDMLNHWRATTESINSIHDIFLRLRTAQKSSHPFSLIILDIATDDRKMKSILLQNLTEQFEHEFDCDVIICCTPSHQRIFKAHAEKPRVGFVNKPITYDGLLQVLSRQLNIAIRDQRLLENTGNIQPITEKNKVLLVDDNPANLQLATEFLRDLNTEVTTAENGLEAIERAAEKAFDIIFMDIQMPSMDGIEATRRLREQEQEKHAKRTPIIALTAHSLTEQKAELLIAGFDDCLSKPVSEQQLAHVISRWTTISNTLSEEEEALKHPPVFQDANDDTASVDIALCLKLANYKPALAKDMLSMLLENLSADQATINRAYRDNDFVLLQERIHRLYGSCCYCGLPRLKRISSLFDKLLQAKQYHQTEEVIASLNIAIDDIQNWAEDKDLNQLFGLKHD